MIKFVVNLAASTVSLLALGYLTIAMAWFLSLFTDWMVYRVYRLGKLMIYISYGLLAAILTLGGINEIFKQRASSVNKNAADSRKCDSPNVCK